MTADEVEQEFRTSPYHEFLGLEFRSNEPGTAEIDMPFREELVSDPDVPYLHGGVIAALLDIAGDYAVATQLGRGVPTIDMRVDFLKTAGREREHAQQPRPPLPTSHSHLPRCLTLNGKAPPAYFLRVGLP